MEYVSPILDGHTPFFFDVHDGEVHCFLCSYIIGKLDLRFGVFTDAPVQVFNGIGGVNDFPDLEREAKIAGKFLPVVTSGFYHILVF